MDSERWGELLDLVRNRLPGLEEAHPDVARALRDGLRVYLDEALEILERIPTEKLSAAQRVVQESARAEILAVRAMLDGQRGAE